MTSEKAVDLRLGADAAAVSARLHFDWPAPFDDASFDGERASGVNASVLVVRHLFGFLYAILDAEGRDALEEDDGNPMLAAAWKQMPAGRCVTRATLAGEIKAKFGGAGKLALVDIMESGLMRATLWRKDMFVLHHPTVEFRDLSAPDAGWQQTACEAVLDLAKAGLVVWDGQRPLNEAANDKFGRFACEELRR